MNTFIPGTINPQCFFFFYFNKLLTNYNFLIFRFEDIDHPIIDIDDQRFVLNQKCYCDKCNSTFNEILKGTKNNLFSQLIIV